MMKLSIVLYFGLKKASSSKGKIQFKWTAHAHLGQHFTHMHHAPVFLERDTYVMTGINFDKSNICQTINLMVTY